MYEYLVAHQVEIMMYLGIMCTNVVIFVLLMRSIPKKRRRALLGVQACAMVIMYSDCAAYVFRGDPSRLGFWAVRISNFLVYFLIIGILFSFNAYIIDLYESTNNRRSKRLKCVNYLIVIGELMLIAAQFNGWYYYFDAQNYYHRGPLFMICYLIPAGILLIQLTVIIQNFKKMSFMISLSLLIFSVFPFLAAALQVLLYGLSLINTTIAAMAMLLYIFAVGDMNNEVERAHKHEIEMMAQYQRELEETVALRTKELKESNEKVEYLLLNILPETIAKELTEDPNKVISNKFPNVTVLFTDVVSFTKISSEMSAQDTVIMLNKMITLFDNRAAKEGIEKIKTIGDAYMAAVGLTDDADNNGAERMVRFAQGLLEDMEEFNRTSSVKLQIRIGINSGELVAGVIGKTKFIYDIWGDNVNIASRMESTGKPGRIHVSEATYNQVKDKFEFKERVETEVKGKGLMVGYFM